MTRRGPIPDTVMLHVPFRIVKRGGRKEMQLPEGATQSRRTDSTLVKALARAFRWKRMLESGEFATIAELAEREGIAPSYMTRVLRLTLLAPEVIEKTLDGRQPEGMMLSRLMEPFPPNGKSRKINGSYVKTVPGRAIATTFASSRSAVRSSAEPHFNI